MHLFAIPTSTLQLLHHFYTNLNNETFEKIFQENRNFGKNRKNHMPVVYNLRTICWQIRGLRWNINNIIFQFRFFHRKANDKIFQKCKKKYNFKSILGPFSPFLDKTTFSLKCCSCQLFFFNSKYHCSKFQKKTNECIPSKTAFRRAHRHMDRQAWIYRNFSG